MARTPRAKAARGWTTGVTVGSLAIVKGRDGKFRPYRVAETISRDMSAVLRVADASGTEHDMPTVTDHYYQWTVPADRIDVTEAMARGPWESIDAARADLVTIRR